MQNTGSCQIHVGTGCVAGNSSPDRGRHSRRKDSIAQIPSYVTVQSPFGAPVILSRYIQILCLFCFLSNLTTPMEPKCSAMSASAASGGRPLTYTMSQSLSPSSKDIVSGLYAMTPSGLFRSHLQDRVPSFIWRCATTVAAGQMRLLPLPPASNDREYMWMHDTLVSMAYSNSHRLQRAAYPQISLAEARTVIMSTSQPYRTAGRRAMSMYLLQSCSAKGMYAVRRVQSLDKRTLAPCRLRQSPTVLRG
jgi:hypothetical protein